VVANDGSRLSVEADTLCIHGDTPGAPAIARAVRDALVAAGVAVRAPDA
jgi:5-oxoprolinase (ATP-hydrolysing) subunit A